MHNLFCGLSAALFDLDGTLIETHIDFDLMRAEAARLAMTFGIEGPPPRDILGGVADTVDRLRTSGRAADADRFRREAFAMLQKIEVEQCGAPAEVPGAARLLDLLEERGVAVGIVTRNCRLVSEKLLLHGGLHCRCLLTRDDVPRTKPDPSHLLAALECLQVGRRTTDDGRPQTDSELGTRNSELSTLNSQLSNAPHALMIGDHFMDVQAGRAAGMRTIGVLHGKPRSFFDDCPPDLIVESMAELLVIVEARL